MKCPICNSSRIVNNGIQKLKCLKCGWENKDKQTSLWKKENVSGVET